MVRLKGFFSLECWHIIYLFQFHYGTIKSGEVISFNTMLQQFQFHYGTIKSLPATFPADVAIYFNSTMVRLKACEKPVYAPLLIAFQFHYGTIKRIRKIVL